ncbi:hypothetical protein ABZ281_24955 [Streptomyces sp. NPDC006265]|uniref:hypothetical protein n=1 Tax=Streptomyces sp. NPDC006265 TaxID=3156740 RepID=UPI0033AA78EA
MSRERPGPRDRVRGAVAAGCFGAVVTGPQELFGSGVGRGFLLALSVGAVTGSAVGFAFPSVLRRGRREPPTLPPPPIPPPPPERRT